MDLNNHQVNKETNPAYACWLNYHPIQNQDKAEEYRSFCSSITVTGASPLLSTAISELEQGIEKMLGIKPGLLQRKEASGGILLGLVDQVTGIPEHKKEQITEEGFIIEYCNPAMIISGKTYKGILYGVFTFLRLLQLQITPPEMARLEIRETRCVW